MTAAFITPGSANVICGMGSVVKTLGESVDEQIVKLDAGLKCATGENPKRVYDALRALTINPAKICGVDDRMGSIQRGKDADLVLWEGDPFDARTRTAAVWINGRPVDMDVQAFAAWR